MATLRQAGLVKLRRLLAQGGTVPKRTGIGLHTGRPEDIFDRSVDEEATYLKSAFPEGYYRMRGIHRQGANRAAAERDVLARLGVDAEVTERGGESRLPISAFQQGVNQSVTRDINRQVGQSAAAPPAERAGGPVDTAGIGLTRALAELEFDALQQRQARATPVTPREAEEQFAGAEAFQERRGVEELPTINGVRRFGSGAAIRPGITDPFLNRLLISGGGRAGQSNVVAGAIGLKREQLRGEEQRKAIELRGKVQEQLQEARQVFQRDLAEFQAAGIERGRALELAERRYRATLAGLEGLGQLEISAQRYGQTGGTFGFGQETNPAVQSRLDALEGALTGKPGDDQLGAQSPSSITREEAIELFRQQGVLDPTDDEIRELMGR